ncbi:MAG: hypothetical protein JXB30_00430 [Anaerolineae bacterium]|nr:hypothetical protein [Anaerolineae bacterium]
MASYDQLTAITDCVKYWQPHPFNIWISGKPYNDLQSYILEQLCLRLESAGCIIVEDPEQQTEIGLGAQLGIVCGKDMDEEISPLTLLGQLPKPRGMMLVINTVEAIPQSPLFDLARGQLVKKAGHIGVLAEGEPDGSHVKRALWASMAGNNRMLNGSTQNIFDQLALRIQANVSAEKINTQSGEVKTPMSWDEWCALPIHQEIARSARRLGAAGIIEDEVPLVQYGTGTQVRSVLRFLRRAALGEGMRSQIIPGWRIMGVTTSGGNKINVSTNPHDGHIVPVSQLTWSGYVLALPHDCPIVYISPSVETHENGMIYLASALVNAGLVNSFGSFFDYLQEHFNRHERIDILPEGMQPKVTVIDHFHRQPRQDSIKEPERVEIVFPDTVCFPEIDFPCGAREAELHLLSAIFKSKAFQEPGLLGNKAIIAVLPGHGSVALYDGPRDELTDLLVEGMEMEEVVRI